MATITGTSGSDVLRGTNGNDLIRGLAGSDTLIGRDGNDRYSGGLGQDFYVVNEHTDDEHDITTILDFNRAQGDKIRLIDIVDNFRDLDSNGDGQVNAADQDVSLVNGNLRIRLEDDDDDDVGVLVINNRQSLVRNDFQILNNDDDDRLASLTHSHDLLLS